MVTLAGSPVVSIFPLLNPWHTLSVATTDDTPRVVRQMSAPMIVPMMYFIYFSFLTVTLM